MTNTGWFDAIKDGNMVLVQEMLERDPALVNARSGISAVMTAMYYSEPQIAKLLIEKGAQLDIFDAAASGQTERLRELLDQNTDSVNAYSGDGFQPLGLASFFGHFAAASELIARGAEVNSASRNTQMVQPLHSAVASNAIDIVRMLLKAGAAVNAAQQDGFTPLHGAAQEGNIALIKLLLEYGAKKDTRSADGKTPYDTALAAGKEEAAKLLQ